MHFSSRKLCIISDITECNSKVNLTLLRMPSANNIHGIPVVDTHNTYLVTISYLISPRSVFILQTMFLETKWAKSLLGESR